MQTGKRLMKDTLAGSYFLYPRPQIERLNARANYHLFVSDIANKGNYSPEHPMFQEAEDDMEEARERDLK